MRTSNVTRSNKRKWLYAKRVQKNTIPCRYYIGCRLYRSYSAS